jgi:hypothetical protein
VALGGSTGPVIIRFAETGYLAAEGEQLLPLLEFNRPFTGVVHYRVDGTGGYLPVPGLLQANGPTAVIPLSLTDNNEIGQLKHLSLILESGPGYQLGQVSRTTVTIDENDAQWEGQFAGEGGVLPFKLTMLESGNLVSASLHGDAYGFFPTNAVPATVTSTEDSFTAVVSGISLPAEATLLGAALELTLELRAANGEPDQGVSWGKIRGLATLITHIPALPHLDTTNRGSFLLLKPQVDPATNDLSVVQNP